MKKLIWFLAAPVMVSMMAVSCGKDNGGDNSGKDDDSGSDDTSLVIDGKFSDWDALDPSAVVTASVAVDDDKKALRTIKFYDTDDLLYVYAEVDPAEIGTSYIEANKWDSGKSQPRPLRFVLDADNNEATGGVMALEFPDGEWGGDVLIDAYIYADGGKVKLGWSECWSYNPDKVGNDKNTGNGYNFVDHIDQNMALDNMVITPANVSGSIVKGFYGLELAIDKTAVPDLGKTVKVGAILINDNWSEPGVLPADGKPLVLNLK